MMWLWIALAFVGGTAIGIAYGHRARITAYYLGTVDGYRLGLKDGWDDGEEFARANPNDSETDDEEAQERL